MHAWKSYIPLVLNVQTKYCLFYYSTVTAIQKKCATPPHIDPPDVQVQYCMYLLKIQNLFMRNSQQKLTATYLVVS